MTLQEMVQTAARLYAERRAVCFDKCNNRTPVVYTYKTVINLATELTDFLREHCHLSENVEIGLYCHIGINLPSWIIGILQVPAAYSPIDPDVPPNLSAYFMKKCNFQYILVEKDKVDKFTSAHGYLFSCNSLEMQKVGLILFQQNNSNTNVNPLLQHVNEKNESFVMTNSWESHILDRDETKPSKELLDVRQKHSIAYVLHTSGTTGVPKIVRVPHKCIVPNILHLRQEVERTAEAAYTRSLLGLVLLVHQLINQNSTLEADVSLLLPLMWHFSMKSCSKKPRDNHRTVTRIEKSISLALSYFIKEIFKITPDDTVFMASPLTFDPSVVELFIALATGALLLIVPKMIKMMPQELSKVLFQHHRVSVLQATPTLLRRFGVQHIKSTVLSADTSLRILALGGEAFPGLDVLRSWRGQGNKTHIFNMYGITEVSCWATCYKVPEEFFSTDHRFDLLVPLGTPLSGTTVEVKEPNGSAILEGEGQVFLGGKERVCFLDDEVTLPMGTVRATGDFVLVKDCEMFFLGRKDNQIKRHGKRLNLEYVQQIAEGCCQVESCAVIWYQEEKLILFIVSKDIFKKRDLLKKLEECLPSYAVPDELLLIDSLPLTSHGKIDVSELSQIYNNHLNSRKRDSKLIKKEELWERLQSVWKSLLNLPDDSSSILKDSLFLHSGGDSLKSLQFLDEIEHMVGRTVPGLLEIILSNSIGEVYNHVLKTVFLKDDLKLSFSGAVKRKASGGSREEPSKKYGEPKSERCLAAEAAAVRFVAVSRGNRSLSIDEPLKKKDISESGILKSKCDKGTFSNANIMETDSIKKSPGQETLGQTAEKLMLHIRWKSDLGKCVDASPLVLISITEKVSAFVYIGSHSHVIQALDLHSGDVKWERKLADRIESSACASTCGNFIIVGSYNGVVYVLRSNNGEIHWSFATDDAVKSSAAVDPSTGLVFIGSHDQHVYALDIYKEECVWKLHSEGGAVFSSPQLNLLPHHLYIATLGGLLLAVNPLMGNTVWKRSCGKPLFSSPHCNKDYVCVGCVDGNLYCFSHFGEKVWEFSSNGPIFSSPCISNLAKDIFFGSHDCFTYCCDMEGNLLWKFETTSAVYATPFVFHSHNKTLLAVVSTDGSIWILNTKTGLVEGTGKLPGEAFSSPVVWGTMMVVGCRNNHVYCLDVCLSETNKIV